MALGSSSLETKPSPSWREKDQISAQGHFPAFNETGTELLFLKMQASYQTPPPFRIRRTLVHMQVPHLPGVTPWTQTPALHTASHQVPTPRPIHDSETFQESLQGTSSVSTS